MTTPFLESGAIDVQRMIPHALRCLAEGCDSITAFGTTGEGASISHEERAAALAALIAGGVAPDRIVYGVAETSIGAAISQSRAAIAAGCRAVLLLPPFYFKAPSAAGVFDWYAAVLGGLGETARDVVLYHIPSVTEVPLTLPLIRRIADAFPKAVRGVKDSGCIWADTEKLLAARGDLEIMVGDERDLARAVRAGGAGAISGMANVSPKRIRGLAVDGVDDPAVYELVDAVVRLPVTPAVKALVAHVSGDAAWLRTRPPLEPTPSAAAATLAEVHDRVFPEGRPNR